MAPDKVVVVTGVGGMGRAVARRVGLGSVVVVGDFDEVTLDREVTELTRSGYDAIGVALDISDAASVDGFVSAATDRGEVTAVVHTAGLSPVQASAEAILKVDLLGAALVLERFGQVIAAGGAGVFVASMAGTTRPADPELDQLLAWTPTEQLLSIRQVAEISDPGSAYGLAKRANQVRMWSACMAWGARGARVNSISPGIIATPMGNAELEGPSGEMMRAMIENSATKRVGTPEDIAAAVEFLIGPNATFVTGTDLLVDGGEVPFIRSALAAMTPAAPASS